MADIKKCKATGKVSFATMAEARALMLMLKWRHKLVKDSGGKRMKHRMGKPAQRRAYYCSHCDGYHLTHWSKGHFNSYKEWLDKEIGGENIDPLGK